MYKVSEVANIVGVSTTTIYSELKQLDKKFQSTLKGKKMITEQGLEYFKTKYTMEIEEKSTYDVVHSLLKQLEEKDRQIQEKDNQISQLIEQARNYQILLKSEQDKMILLTEKKPKLLQRIFGKNKNDTTS